jgi:hypothetical protein
VGHNNKQSTTTDARLLPASTYATYTPPSTPLLLYSNLNFSINMDSPAPSVIVLESPEAAASPPQVNSPANTAPRENDASVRGTVEPDDALPSQAANCTDLSELTAPSVFSNSRWLQVWAVVAMATVSVTGRVRTATRVLFLVADSRFSRVPWRWRLGC